MTVEHYRFFKEKIQLFTLILSGMNVLVRLMTINNSINNEMRERERERESERGISAPNNTCSTRILFNFLTYLYPNCGYTM